MDINFVVPTTKVYGGIRAVFELSNQLERRGHDIRVVVPIVPLIPDTGLRAYLRAAKDVPLRWLSIGDIDWFDLEAEMVTVPHLSTSRFVPNADASVATWWKTAPTVAAYPESKGEGFYFVQHLEKHAGSAEEVLATYDLPLNRITTSTWLRERLEELDVPIDGQVLYGVDFDRFYPESKEVAVEPPIRVGMMYSERRWKGFAEGSEAFDNVDQDTDVNMQLILFGKVRGDDVPSDAEFYCDPKQDKLRQLYDSMDLFVMPSHHEGFGMPPMEAMACRTATLVTDVGGVPDYTVPGETSEVVPPKDVDALTSALHYLVTSPSRLENLAIHGHEHIQQFTWETAGETFEGLLQDGVTASARE